MSYPVQPGKTNCNIPVCNLSLKLKTYGFAIAIIVGICGLAAYFHVGALNTITQVDGIVMMAMGGAVLLIIGIVGAAKTCCSKKVYKENTAIVLYKRPSSADLTHDFQNLINKIELLASKRTISADEVRSAMVLRSNLSAVVKELESMGLYTQEIKNSVDIARARVGDITFRSPVPTTDDIKRITHFFHSPQNKYYEAQVGGNWIRYHQGDHSCLIQIIARKTTECGFGCINLLLGEQRYNPFRGEADVCDVIMLERTPEQIDLLTQPVNNESNNWRTKVSSLFGKGSRPEMIKAQLEAQRTCIEHFNQNSSTYFENIGYENVVAASDEELVKITGLDGEYAKGWVGIFFFYRRADTQPSRTLSLDFPG